MQKDIQPFIPRIARKSLIVDLDRVFVDIMDAEDFRKLLNSQVQTMLSGRVKKINFNQMEFCVVVRPDTVQFFRKIITYYNVHVVTWMRKDLVMRLLDLVDPERAVF